MLNAVSDVAQVKDEVRALADRIAGRGAEIEQAGRLPADIVAGLHEAGVFRLWLPIELGGFEARPADVVQLVQVLAEADGSTGWCAATGVASNIVGALVSQDAARRLYITGSELCGGALMPGGQATVRPDGGFSLTGRWSFGSGTQHCDWLVGGAVLAGQDGAPPSMRAMLMPRSAVEFLDNWQAVGLLGTASVDYQVTDLAVPAEHAIDLATMTPWPAGSMWQIPLRSLLYPLLGAVPLGIARRALSELVEQCGRTRYGSSSRLADREVVQVAIGRAQALVESGSAYLTASLQALRDAADTGAVPTPVQRATARLAAVHATEQATEAVSLCYRTAGAVAIHRDSPLQRALRDVHTATQHYALSGRGYDLAGRLWLGFEPDPLL
ncbi:MAG: acyl-CoA dehydrogenase family protein [Jatrophihabitans sp.]